MSAYATAVTEMTREDLIAELFRHKDAKDAAREEGRQAGRAEAFREAAEIARRWVNPKAQGFNESMIHNTATMIAQAIDARAKEKQP